MEQKGESVFRSPLPWTGKPTEAVVISCSDHRFQVHFDRFLREGLKVDSFGRFAVPGGPQFLLADDAPALGKAGRLWAEFLTRQVGIRQLICLGHEDCLWYKSLTPGRLTPPHLKERQTADLRQARLVLQEMFPEVAVRIYYADIRGDDRAPFVEFAEIR